MEMRVGGVVGMYISFSHLNKEEPRVLTYILLALCKFLLEDFIRSEYNALVGVWKDTGWKTTIE